jgi:hypothetical protein
MNCSERRNASARSPDPPRPRQGDGREPPPRAVEDGPQARRAPRTLQKLLKNDGIATKKIAIDASQSEEAVMKVVWRAAAPMLREKGRHV